MQSLQSPSPGPYWPALQEPAGVGGPGPTVGDAPGTPTAGAGEGWGAVKHLEEPALEYCPAGQLTQEAPPVAAWYLPLSHRTQSLRESAPVTAQYVPEGQFRQALVPLSGRYFPAGHCKHDT